MFTSIIPWLKEKVFYTNDDELTEYGNQVY